MTNGQKSATYLTWDELREALATVGYRPHQDSHILRDYNMQMADVIIKAFIQKCKTAREKQQA